jgi:SAM-dependent methyltransferase
MRLERSNIFTERLINFGLRLNGRLWKKLPGAVSARWPVRQYGDFLHALARRHGARTQAPSTFFLRNRPQLELIRRLTERREKGDVLKVAVLGCSTGAEVYSIAWTIRSARPDLRLNLSALDISRRAVEFAECGTYSLVVPQLTNTDIFERMNEAEMMSLFDQVGNSVKVKPWIREAITWQTGDVADFDAVESLALQDIVAANNFLCHMPPPLADRCLRNIARLVRPNGYLFVSGIDLDVKTKVADDLGWAPLDELVEEIHEGDPSNRNHWPFHYAGLEPLNKNRQDWKRHYASVYQVPRCDMKIGGLANSDVALRVAAVAETIDDLP